MKPPMDGPGADQLGRDAASISDVDAVRAQIRKAFPAEPFLGPISGPCQCDECTALADSLRHKTWDQLDDATMDIQFGAMPLLTPEAFPAYLAAWLMRSLKNLENEDQKFREWTLYYLALYHEETDPPDELPRAIAYLQSKAACLSSEQVAAVNACLQFIKTQAELSEWDREAIDRASELVWGRH
jgi:hypothetical protein